jgi:hypothetical protein
MQRVRREGLPLVAQWKTGAGSTREVEAMATSASGTPPTVGGLLLGQGAKCQNGRCILPKNQPSPKAIATAA